MVYLIPKFLPNYVEVFLFLGQSQTMCPFSVHLKQAPVSYRHSLDEASHIIYKFHTPCDLTYEVN